MNRRDPRATPQSAFIGRKSWPLGTLSFVALTVVSLSGVAADADVIRIPPLANDTHVVQRACDTEEQPIEDEIKVIGERTPLTLEERVRIYRELARARELYSRNQIDEAFPLLLKTARKGFKNAQARVGHIYLRGLGEIDQDPVEALGWLGVASAGNTSPPIRNYFNDIWKRLPDKHVSYLEEVVEEYRSKYGEHATGVVCELHRPVRTYVKQLVCYFEQDLPDMVREPLEDHFESDERRRYIEETERRAVEAARARRAAPALTNGNSP